MAIQSTTYNTDGTTRTFPSTKPIPTISHVGVYLKRVIDNVWVQVNVGDYTLVQSSIIMDVAPDVLVHSQLEVRVADDPAEITTSPSNVAIVAGDTTVINTVATNINAVINNSTNIGAVTNVSANIASVNAVSTDIVKVRTVADSITNVNTVSTNMVNVNAVGLDLLEPVSEINTVALSIVNVDTVATNIVNVNTVATNIVNVNNVATTVVPNIAEILLADDNAATATAQAGVATTQATLSTNKALESQHWANYTTDVAVPEGTGEFSAKHYATKAAASALSVAPVNQQINAATAKTTPVDADLIGLVDSADSFSLKKISWANIKTALGLIFAPLASPAFTDTPTAPTAAAGTNTTQLATTAFVQSATGQVLSLTYEEPDGTNGFSATANVRNTIPLNTVKLNTISGASLSAGRFTLPAGTYTINANSTHEQNGSAQMWLHIPSTQAIILMSTPCIELTYARGFKNVINGAFTLSVETELELTYRCSVTSRIGIATSFTGVVETYADLLIHKIG